MKNFRVSRLLVAAFALVSFCRAMAQQELELMDPPPVTGTFYFAQRTNVPPFWFDPFGGQLPVYRIDGHKFLIDDTAVDYSAGESQLSGVPNLWRIFEEDEWISPVFV